ncbi:MAG: sigma-70 family RNA polymerase sigma factor [candidate division KSB1 bacterium]|nr:sigma-70 family RNA polymerase sigma factor [candidate division KSB1 bacterium]MDZ7378241.1 sigma-70 family RNA polymerase sigma factor [candidate division KSB1 bacterium]MDZ7412891.1 sigma-70 family RNA polymerase sigma factor [candidate division KSB1 bacterium]
MDSDEVMLIRRAQQGDSQAFDQLVRRHDRQVLSLAYDLTGNIEDAKDIYQEVFLRTYRRIQSFRFESAFSTWLYRITLNCALSFRRRRMQEDLLSLESWQGSGNLISRTADPHTEAEGADFRARMEKALACLSAKERAVFVLRHYHGHKLTEISELMNTKLGTVKNYLFRATQKMRRQLSVDLEE